MSVTSTQLQFRFIDFKVTPERWIRHVVSRQKEQGIHRGRVLLVDIVFATVVIAIG